MEFFTSMMERVVAFWRNRRFFQFRKFYKFPPFKASFRSLKQFQLYLIVHLHHVTAQCFERWDSLASGLVDVKSKNQKILNLTLRTKTFFRCLHLQPTISNKEGQKSGACLTSFTNFPFSSSWAFTTTSKWKKDEKNCLSKEEKTCRKKSF